MKAKSRGKKRTPDRKANYRGATPEQVARAFYWHRRRKKPACHAGRVSEDDPVVTASI